MGKEQKKAVDTSKHKGQAIDKVKRETLINKVTDLYLKGYSYRKIAKDLEDQSPEYKISIVTVGNYINKVLKEWKDHRIEKMDDLKTVELNRINKLENTYWEGWERSLEGSKRTSEKQKAAPGTSIGEGGAVTKTMNVVSADKASYTEETFGDPRFLAGIQWCISMRCKILGIEAPIEFKGSMTSEIKRTTVFKTTSRNKPQ